MSEVDLKESFGVKMRPGILRSFGHVVTLADKRLTKQIYNENAGECGYRGRPRLLHNAQIGRRISSF